MNDTNADNMPEDAGDEMQPAEISGTAGADAARVAALEAELGALKDQALRALAEAENTRRRAVKERDDMRKFAIADFARDILGFADNFRRAREAIPADLAATDDRFKNVIVGIEAMEREVVAVLDKHGVKRLNPMGEPFNPNFHEVMFEAPGTGKPGGTVVQVIETGYVIHDRLLRPARVGVAANDGGVPAGPGGQIDTSA